MSGQLAASGAIVALWALLAALMPLFGPRHRSAAWWLLVVAGVPLLGWLTLKWGPGIGVLAFALGALALWRRPSQDRASVRDRHVEPAE
ncbi:DUF2484 family protein [Paracoccus sp. TK19116]|uniref:DUF2484 family protein n=1 Tax=Paracoccus albicereus TaxID=2922394 RepID=A0ABT1MTZ0_9RHOB|nr:DUF2484 family protein [Paracoccus albicereus]MCQ0970788.1 DUF2484 family protein [Paracoccus albicereus]